MTLVELMVTLAVAIVILAIGIPAFNSMSARDMSAATVNSLVTALQQARMEAISSGSRHRVCGRTLQDNCQVPPAPVDSECDETNWRCGWAVVRSSDVAAVERPIPPLRLYPEHRGQVSVSGVPADLDATGFVEFGGMGQRTLPDPATAVAFVVTAYRDSSRTTCVRVTNVIVTGVGQVRSENPACP